MLRKTLGLITLLVFIGLFFYAAKYPTHQNLGVVAFGDSLVEGVGSLNGEGFVGILEKELKVPIVNLGRSGDTTQKALERVREVTILKPAIALVLLGGNDFFQGVREDQIQANLGAIISEIQNSGAKVILIGLEAEVGGEKHRTIFENLTKQYDLVYVPDILDGLYGNPAFMSSDDIHPNEKGYALMAQRIRPALEELY